MNVKPAGMGLERAGGGRALGGDLIVFVDTFVVFE